MSEGCDTTELEDVLDGQDVSEEEDFTVSKTVSTRIAEPKIKNNIDDDDENDHDGETVILLQSVSRRQSPSITERSFSTLFDNPPPSPVTDSS